METYTISHERFQAWLEAQKKKGIEVTTGTFNAMKDLLERRHYNGPLPDDVEERRQAQRELRELREIVDKHEGLLVGLFRQLTASLGGLMHLDTKLTVKEKAGKK